MPNQFNVSLWGDEGFSAILSMKSVPEIIETISRDTSPPLYNLTEHIAFKLFGTSEIVIRGLSFFYYLIAVFFIYKIASHFWNRKTGIIVGMLTFLNPFFFIYAFEGRMYSLLAATIVASMYFFSTRKWLGHIVATTLALYSHHFAIFAIFIEGLWFIKMFIDKKERKDAVNAFKSFLIIGFLYIPWIMPLINQTKMVTGGFWLGTPNATDLRKLIYKFLAEGNTHQLAKLSLWLVWIILVIRLWHKKIKITLFSLLWFLVPVFLTWIVSQKIQSIFYDRYLLYCIPAAMVILGTNTRKISYLFIAVLIFFFGIIDYEYFTHPTKKPFREMAAYVLEAKKGDDYLINWNSASHHLWESKYYGIPAPIYISQNTELPFFVGTALMTKDDTITAIPKNIYRVGVITSGPVDEVKVPGYTNVEQKQFGELSFIWLQK